MEEVVSRRSRKISSKHTNHDDGGRRKIYNQWQSNKKNHVAWLFWTRLDRSGSRRVWSDSDHFSWPTLEALDVNICDRDFASGYLSITLPLNSWPFYGLKNPFFPYSKRFHEKLSRVVKHSRAGEKIVKEDLNSRKEDFLMKCLIQAAVGRDRIFQAMWKLNAPK